MLGWLEAQPKRPALIFSNEGLLPWSLLALSSYTAWSFCSVPSLPGPQICRGRKPHVLHTVTLSAILVICLLGGGGGPFQQPADSCHGITLFCFASPGLVLTALSNCTASQDKCCDTTALPTYSFEREFPITFVMGWFVDPKKMLNSEPPIFVGDRDTMRSFRWTLMAGVLMGRSRLGRETDVCRGKVMWRHGEHHLQAQGHLKLPRPRRWHWVGSPYSPARSSPGDLLVQTYSLQRWERMNSAIDATQPVVLCRGSPRKLTQYWIWCQ